LGNLALKESWDKVLGQLPKEQDPEGSKPWSTRQIGLRVALLVLQTCTTVQNNDDGVARQQLMTMIHKWKIGNQQFESHATNPSGETDNTGPSKPHPVTTVSATGMPLLDARGEPMSTQVTQELEYTWVVNNKLATQGLFYKYMCRELLIDALAVSALSRLVGVEVEMLRCRTRPGEGTDALELVMMRTYRQVVCVLEAFRKDFIQDYPCLVDFNTARRLFERSYLWETHVVVPRNGAAAQEGSIWSLRCDRYPEHVVSLAIIHEDDSAASQASSKWHTSVADLKTNFRTFQSRTMECVQKTTSTGKGKRQTSEEVIEYLACVRLLDAMGAISKPNKLKRKLLLKTEPLIKCVGLCLRLVLRRGGVPKDLDFKKFNRIPNDLINALKSSFLASEPVTLPRSEAAAERNALDANAARAFRHMW
jgi:hypothetical protein